ncbi:hypothetical protein PCI56_01510 [Plesiomonas shigelloides subsp. oncorhynchi]|nr:hypothetical protein [Plesiomonas shigelloides]
MENPQCSECFPAKSALVVVATPNVVARRLLEDELAKQLRQHQVQAVVSYLYFSTPTSNTADNHSQEVLALAKQLHLDNILTTQVMKVTQPQVYSAPAPVWGWNNFLVIIKACGRRPTISLLPFMSHLKSMRKPRSTMCRIRNLAGWGVRKQPLWVIRWRH